MNSSNNQQPSDSASPMAEHVQNELRKSGIQSWLGIPASDEMRRISQEWGMRQVQMMKARAEAEERRREQLKQKVRDVIRRNQAEQI